MRLRPVVALLLGLCGLPGLAHAQGVIEVPSPQQTMSGIVFFAGWKCQQGTLTGRVDGGLPFPLAGGIARADTQGVCGDTNNGWITQFNFNSLRPGAHTFEAFDDGVSFGRVAFAVTHFGQEFKTGVTGEGTAALSDGSTATLTWTQPLQTFTIRETVPVPPPTAEDRPDLYALLHPPASLTSVYWQWTKDGRHHHEAIELDFTLHNHIDNFSDSHSLDLILGGAVISDIDFTFGLESNLLRSDGESPARGVTFLRWQTDDLANARVAPTGFRDSAGPDGIRVGRPYAWSAGAYRARVARYDSDSLGDWFGFWLTDQARGRTTWIGALRFPRSADRPARLPPYLISNVQVYGPPLRLLDIPAWHVSVTAPLGDWESAPAYADTVYSRPDEIPNTEMWYQADENAVHIRGGGHTIRQTLQTGTHTRYQLPAVE